MIQCSYNLGDDLAESIWTFPMTLLTLVILLSLVMLCLQVLPTVREVHGRKGPIVVSLVRELRFHETSICGHWSAPDATESH